jgi:hypothetical protein
MDDVALSIRRNAGDAKTYRDSSDGWKPVALGGPAVVHAKSPARSAPDAKSAIVIIRKRGSDARHLTPEEHRGRGDAAEALFRKIAAKVG